MVDNPKPPSISFGFINEAVSNQLANSRAILEVAGKLQLVLSNIKEDETRHVIYGAIQELISIANSMTVNAATTTSSASVSVSGIAALPSKK